MSKAQTIYNGEHAASIVNRKPKERPIIFKGWGIRAILDDLKDMTRRLRGLEKFNESPGDWKLVEYHGAAINTAVFQHKATAITYAAHCPYGVPGDRLWVREAWAVNSYWDARKPRDMPDSLAVVYEAGGGKNFPGDYADYDKFMRGRWRRSFFMPRWASRLTLEITEVLPPQRVQEISSLDIALEGVIQPDTELYDIVATCPNEFCGEVAGRDEAVAVFKAEWDKINAKSGHGWDVNEWVWPFRFKKVDGGER